MKRMSLLSLALFFSLTVCHAQEFEVVPPAQGGSSEVAQPAEVTEEDGLISSATPQDSANAAVEKLTRAGGNGVKVIQVGSGRGYVAVGQGSFNSDMANPVAVRIAKSNATVRAYLDAQRRLGEFLKCASIDQAILINEFTDSLNTDELALLKSQNTQGEVLRSAIAAYLAGFILYDVQYKDDEVFVSIVVTPKTLKALRSHRANKVTLKQAKNAEDGIAFVQNDIATMLKNDVIFLTGGKQIFIEPTKEFAFLGFAAEPIRFNQDWPAIQKRRQKVLALQTAENKAKANLLAMLQGNAVGYDFKQTNMTSEEYKQFEESKGEISVFDNAKQNFMNRQKTNEQFVLAVSGRLPAGIQPNSYYYDDNEDGSEDWAFSIAVYIPGVTAEADKLSSDMKKALHPPKKQQPKTQPKPSGNLPSGKTTSDNDL